MYSLKKYEPNSLPWLRRINVLNNRHQCRPLSFKDYVAPSYCDETCPRCGSKETRIIFTPIFKGYVCYCKDCQYGGFVRPTVAEAKKVWSTMWQAVQGGGDKTDD